METPTIKEVNEILEYLKNVDLETVDYDEIRKRTDLLVLCGCGAVEISPQAMIFRGRVTDINKTFKNVSEISYPPASTTFTLNRASSNKFQVFYGAVSTEDVTVDQITSMIEVCQPLDEMPEDTDEYITIGRWFAKEPIILAAVGFHSDLGQITEQGKGLRQFHREFLDHNREVGEKVEAISEFMSKEFSKKVAKGKNYEYKISAAYGDSLFSFGAAGITFPSVKAEGKTFNIALSKDSVDKFLEIDLAGVTRMHKVEGQMSIGWFLVCENVTDRKFIWKDPPRQSVNGAWEIEQHQKRIIAQRNQQNQKQ